MMRRGSLSALTITQRAEDGQNGVREWEEKGKEEGRSRDGREDTREPFNTHNIVSVRQWGLTTSAGVSVGFISMRLECRTLWCYSNASVSASVHVCVQGKHTFFSFLFFFFFLNPVVTFIGMAITSIVHDNTLLSSLTAAMWKYVDIAKPIFWRWVHLKCQWTSLTHSREKLSSKLKLFFYWLITNICLLFIFQKWMAELGSVYNLSECMTHPFESADPLYHLCPFWIN